MLRKLSVVFKGYCRCTSTMNGYSLNAFHFPAPYAATFGYKEVTFEVRFFDSNIFTFGKWKTFRQPVQLPAVWQIFVTSTAMEKL